LCFAWCRLVLQKKLWKLEPAIFLPAELLRAIASVLPDQRGKNVHPAFSPRNALAAIPRR
jgi:hypothetical protein